MLSTRRIALTATCAALFSAALVGCTTAAPATPKATTPVVTTPSAAASASPTAAATASAAPTTVPAEEPTATASGSPSSAPVVTIVPGSSLDPSLSDAGVAGRVTIPDDTRELTDDLTGTHEILGREADGSYCEYSFSGDEFIAYPQYDDAPVGTLYDIVLGVPADEMPANDGEQRAGIQDGRVSVDFHTASLGGGTYSGDATASSNPGSVTIDVSVSGTTYTFTFTGETWDNVGFEGQVICAGVTDS